MYKVILYNGGRRIKCFGHFWKYGDAIRKYNQLMEENQVYFPKKIMRDGSPADYELGITGPPEGKNIDYLRNELGTLIKVKPKGNFVMKKIEPFEIEEEFLYKNTNEVLDFKSLVKRFIVNSDKTNVIYCLNNKVVIEYFENDDIDLFAIKSVDDAIRLSDLIKEFTYANSLSNFIFFTEPTKENKIRLYDKLEEKLGLNRLYLQKTSTE